MANVNLTNDKILRESQRILHQKLNFCSNITTGYDGNFADSGAKIGDSLRVRLPIQYGSATGATMATGTGADTTQTSVTLQVSTQRHVPMRFTSKELTMDIDEFSSRHIEPAMSQLAAMMEYDGLASVYKSINGVVEAGTKVEFADIMNGRAKLQDQLAPANDRTALLDTQANVDLVDSNKSLFNAQDEISKQYKEGSMGRFGGYDFYENTLLPTHTTGAEGGGSAYRVNGASQTKTLSASDPDPQSGSLIVDTGTKTIKAGDVFTIANVNAVHPETKQSLGYLQQFTVTADATGAGTLSISPAIIATGPYQNVDAAPADNAVITFVGAASTTYKQSLLFQKGFAVMGTADLELPSNQDAARVVHDGISMRLVRNAYDVVKDRNYTRLDVLYGFKVIRPQLAKRVLHT